jgi:hypothetical protein
LASKKTIAGIIVLVIAIISGIVLVPVFMYTSQNNSEEEGFKFSGLFKEVTVIDIGLGMGYDISSSASYDPDVITNNTKQTLVPIELYALNQLGGPGWNPSQLAAFYNVELATLMSIIQGMIDIQLSFNLTAPSNDTISYEGDIWGLLGNNFNIQIMLGAEDLLSQTGTFTLELYIEIYINLPDSLFGFDLPDIEDLNYTVGPLSMEFNVTG